MPINVIKSFSKKSRQSTQEVEQNWIRAKEMAKEQNQERNFAYITSLTKKLLKINEKSLTKYLAEVKELYQLCKLEEALDKAPVAALLKKFGNYEKGSQVRILEFKGSGKFKVQFHDNKIDIIDISIIDFN